MTKHIKLGLIGNKLERSRAGHLHELLGCHYGLSLSYTLMDQAGRLDTVDIDEELERCREEGFRGVNVTHPYKRDAFTCVQTVPSFPTGLTSVNTVIFEPERRIADNTDYSGFCTAFRTCFKEQKPGRVLMLGAGGVGLAIAYGLKTLGVTELAVFDTNKETASNLVSQLNTTGNRARIANGDELLKEMEAADGLINATPIGMFQYPGNPFPAAGFRQQKWAFDAVYTPENTEFLQSCRTGGIATLSGFQLFLYQGIHAFERFTTIRPDPAEVEKMFLELYPLS